MAVPSFSDGRVYTQWQVELDDECGSSWPSPGTCVCPTAAQADDLANLLRTNGVECAVSIGCGEGAFEAMLERRGFRVLAVDVDVLSDPRRYATMRCFCSEIRRVRPDTLYRIPDEAAALCFIWGRALPWRTYLRHYPNISIVLIAGEPAAADATDCATEPSGTALDGDDAWHLLTRSPIAAVHGGAMLSVYMRTTPSFWERLGGLDDLIASCVLPSLDVASLCACRATDTRLRALSRAALATRSTRELYEYVRLSLPRLPTCCARLTI